MILLKQITVADSKTGEHTTVKFSRQQCFETFEQVERCRFIIECVMRSMLPDKRVFEVTIEKK